MLVEKSKSKSQQRLMGMAYAYKKGDLKIDNIDEDLLDKIKSMADSMSLKKLKQYAKTKHEDIPEKIEENIITKFNKFKNKI